MLRGTSISLTLYLVFVISGFLDATQVFALTIDSFDGPNVVATNEDNPGSDVAVEQRGLSDVLGGSRAFGVGGIGDSLATISIDSGSLLVDANGGEAGFNLEYGTRQNSEAPFELSLSESDVVEISFDFASWPDVEQLSVRLDGVAQRISSDVDFPKSSEPFVASFPISEMGPADARLSVLDSVIGLKFFGPVSGAYSISEVRIVPEPSRGIAIISLFFAFALRIPAQGGRTHA